MNIEYSFEKAHIEWLRIVGFGGLGFLVTFISFQMVTSWALGKEPGAAFHISNIDKASTGNSDTYDPPHSILASAEFLTFIDAGSEEARSLAQAKEVEKEKGEARGALPLQDSGEIVRVTWAPSLVRSEPRTGKVIARLPKGTEVSLLEKQGGWYRIRFGEINSEKGWIYREAVGR